MREVKYNPDVWVSENGDIEIHWDSDARMVYEEDADGRGHSYAPDLDDPLIAQTDTLVGQFLGDQYDPKDPRRVATSLRNMADYLDGRPPRAD